MYLRTKVQYIQNWKEWVGLFMSSSQSVVLQGLLHAGWGVLISLPKEHEERICLYLEVADGHSDRRLPMPSLAVARKAFAVLAVEFFKGKGQSRPWLYGRQDGKVCEKLLWFFRINSPDFAAGHDPADYIPNLGRGESIHHEFAAEFLRRFVEELYRHARTENYPNAARHRWQVVEILWGLDELYRLLENSRYRHVHTDDVCLDALRNIILRHPCTLQVDKKNDVRKPTSPDEALLAMECRSQRAAEVLTVLSARRVAQYNLETLMKTKNM